MDTKKKNLYDAYTAILKEELVPAMGCTEPIAIAYAGAVARETLGMLPDTVRISASGNIIKNVKSVVVPNTGGLRGIAAAAGAGIIAGKAEKKLEVLAEITREEIQELNAYLDTASFSVTGSQSGCVFDIYIEVHKGEHSAEVQIQGHHTNIVKIRKNGETLFGKDYTEENQSSGEDRSLLNVKDILSYAKEVDLKDVEEVLERQIQYNTAIAEEGLHGNWGANIGDIFAAVLWKQCAEQSKGNGGSGSDARMNGCEMPVVINSGSGNQGMTASLPVIVYAEDMQVSREVLLRGAGCFPIWFPYISKTGIGTLSAYCGAISAGCGAGAGITYLYGGGYEEISHTIVNALAINSGVVCDGAKASCAAKIASAVEAGVLGMKMYQFGSQFYGGDGIVAQGIEETIENVAELARDGMRETDRKIIEIMTDPR